MAAPRSSQTFCARPGCGLAKSGHGFLAGACSRFVEPGSKEANEARRAKLSVVETPAPDRFEDETVEIDPPTDDQLLADYLLLGEML
jgi:hypothetical protein